MQVCICVSLTDLMFGATGGLGFSKDGLSAVRRGQWESTSIGGGLESIAETLQIDEEE